MTTATTDRTLSLEDSVIFAENPEPRCACVLVIDTSGSMRGNRINAVNSALRRFEQDVKDDPLKALRAEIAVIGFNHETAVIQDFAGGLDFHAPVLDTGGGTKIAPALEQAMDLCAARKETYRRNGVTYYRSLILLLTDGYPEHDDPADIDAVAARIRAEEQNRKVACFAFGINDNPGHDGARIADINRMVARPAQELTDTTQIGGVMEWLSNSLSVISQSQPEEKTRLPEMDFLEF